MTEQNIANNLNKLHTKIVRSSFAQYVTENEIVALIRAKNEILEEIQQYKALGTVEELRVARDKQVGKKPKGIDSDICPNCGTYNSVIPQRRNTVGCDTVYCWHCGTAIECEV